jgi:hypothetical protein
VLLLKSPTCTEEQSQQTEQLFAADADRSKSVVKWEKITEHSIAELKYRIPHDRVTYIQY